MMKKKPSPNKMKKPASAVKKALVGKQKSLPAELKKAIIESPNRMLKPAAMKMLKLRHRFSTTCKW